MPESLLSRRLTLGTYAGIPLYVHWSFFLSILYVSLSAIRTGLGGVAFSVAQLLGVFFCVTLHEYGHALAARRFGIATVDITLLPIGGVARLKKMPRIPWQEFVVAVAGPAVNVVIASILGVVLLLTLDPEIFVAIGIYLDAFLLSGSLDDNAFFLIYDLISLPSWTGYGILLLLVNLMLVVFNMIPAFPMDGGRVFRSIMAMFMDYRQATSIAAKVGVVCAMMMAITAVRSDPIGWVPLLIAGFIAYAGMAEARQVTVSETVRGLSVAQVMVRKPFSIPMDLPLHLVAEQLRNTGFLSTPVVSAGGIVVGVLSSQDVVNAIDANRQWTDDNLGGFANTPQVTAAEMVDHSRTIGSVHATDALETVLGQLAKHHRQIPVVDSTNRLVGILDLDTMLTRAELAHRRATASKKYSIAQDAGAGNSGSEHSDAGNPDAGHSDMGNSARGNSGSTFGHDKPSSNFDAIS